MIHGIHGNSKRTYPFTNGNTVVGAFCNLANTSAEAKAACDPALTLAPDVTNFAAEGASGPASDSTARPATSTTRTVNDQGTLGAVILKYGNTAAGPVVFGGATAVANPWDWNVISPKAASCTACHDSPRAIGHVTSFGNATYGNLPQNKWPQETCNDCHAGGLFMGVDRVHGLK